MIRHRRPRKPSDFDQNCAQARAAVSTAIAAGQTTIAFSNVWTNYKGVFSSAQNHKCGYCEIYVTAGQDGDIEHLIDQVLLKVKKPTLVMGNSSEGLRRHERYRSPGW